MTRDTDTTPEQRAHRRAKNYTGMLWHLATFVIINGFFWTIDIMDGGGVNWAFWITLFWGIALLFHVAWYAIDVSSGRRSYDKFLADEQHQGTS